MADRILHRVSYHGVDCEDWLEDREAIVQRTHLVRSTFLNLMVLVKSDRDLQADLEKNGVTAAPRRFADLD